MYDIEHILHAFFKPKSKISANVKTQITTDTLTCRPTDYKTIQLE